MVELSPDAMLVVSDTIEFANSGAMRLFGATRRSELVGKAIARFLDPVYQDLARQRLNQLRDKGGSVPFVEERWRRADDTTFVDLVTFTAVSASTTSGESITSTGTVNQYLRATHTLAG